MGNAQWFLDALRAKRIQTSLQVSQLTPRSGVAAVEELTRLMLTIELPYIRAMVATMLRQTTGKDFTRGFRSADRSALTAIADRYRFHASSVQSAKK